MERLPSQHKSGVFDMISVPNHSGSLLGERVSLVAGIYYKIGVSVNGYKKGTKDSCKLFACILDTYSHQGA